MYYLPLLQQICDFNHNYLGCSSHSEVFLVIDKVVIAIYMGLGACCIYLQFKRGFVLCLLLILASVFFKIAYLIVIPVSFPAAVFLHYLFTQIHQAVIASNLISLDRIAKFLKIDVITPLENKLLSFLLKYGIPSVLILVWLSVNISVFLIALDSNDTSKYYIYHLLQFLPPPIFYLTVLSPYIAYLRNSASRNGAEEIIMGTPNEFLGRNADVIPANQNLVGALIDLLTINRYAWVCLILASLSNLTDVVGLYLDEDGILVVKLVSEGLNLSVTIILMLLFNYDKSQDNKPVEMGAKSLGKEKESKVLLINPDSMPTVIIPVDQSYTNREETGGPSLQKKIVRINIQFLILTRLAFKFIPESRSAAVMEDVKSISEIKHLEDSWELWRKM
jgi:hypothetical protein